ncbi:acyltransferase [Cochlodiniinecator piscidefendens]|uniref:acyltransferase n=1 Tax=Cochlodiniinecator piscidefendens TaxID=2715756 RepID=UPI00140A7796|nr:acyltransferase [Cochlodiniinecator piscidefendens]
MSDIFIHPTAEVSDKANIGNGTKIWNLAQVRENCHIGVGCILSKNVYVDFEVEIGDRVKIQNNVSVYHGVTIGNDVFVGPMVVFTNDFRPRAFNADWAITPTKIEDGASLGAGCLIVCGTIVGQYAMVAAGAVVTRDVPAHGLVMGNPARLVGYVYKNGRKVEDGHKSEDGKTATCPITGETIKI